MEDQRKETSENYKVMLERLKLDLKDCMALAKNSDTYLAEMRREILESPDLEVRSFVSLASYGKRRAPRTLFIIAAGEITFAAILLFMGLVLIFPAFFYYANPEVLLNYFGSHISAVAPGSIESEIVLLVDFLISAIMLLSAFQIIRIASRNLKEAGFTVSDAL